MSKILNPFTNPKTYKFIRDTQSQKLNFANATLAFLILGIPTIVHARVMFKLFGNRFKTPEELFKSSGMVLLSFLPMIAASLSLNKPVRDYKYLQTQEGFIEAFSETPEGKQFLQDRDRILSRMTLLIKDIESQRDFSSVIGYQGSFSTLYNTYKENDKVDMGVKTFIKANEKKFKEISELETSLTTALKTALHNYQNIFQQYPELELGSYNARKDIYAAEKPFEYKFGEYFFTTDKKILKYPTSTTLLICSSESVIKDDDIREDFYNYIFGNCGQIILANGFPFMLVPAEQGKHQFTTGDVIYTEHGEIFICSKPDLYKMQLQYPASYYFEIPNFKGVVSFDKKKNIYLNNKLFYSQLTGPEIYED